MPRQIINLIGVAVSLAVVALGVFLVAVPLYVQSLDQTAQTAEVAATNELYQAQVDQLRTEEEHLDEINASVAALQQQVPAVGQLDDVFEVVGLAAKATGVTVQAVTAGTPAPYAVRTGPTTDEETAAEVPAESTAESSAGDADGSAVPTDATPTGRQQVDFAISVSAAEASQVTAFLDALRAGPRLLSSVTVSTARTGDGGFDVQVDALTFLDAEG